MTKQLVKVGHIADLNALIPERDLQADPRGKKDVQTFMVFLSKNEHTMPNGHQNVPMGKKIEKRVSLVDVCEDSQTSTEVR